MTFAQLEGNEDVRAALSGMVDSGRIPHAILFHEDDGGGAFPLCIAFLQYLYCNGRVDGDSCGTCPSCGKLSRLIHPDLHLVVPTAAGTLTLQYMAQLRDLFASSPYFTEAQLGEALGIEGKNSLIAVAEAKSLLDSLSLSALEGGYRSVVIYLPEKMNQEASNRLLKMIEEPPVKTQFLLITHHPEKVLATISSRCQRIRVRPQQTSMAVDFPEPEIFSALMDALVSRRLLQSLDIVERLASLPSREMAKAFCGYAASKLREIFLAQQGVASVGAVSPEAAAWAGKCRKTFPRQALTVLDRTRMLIDRNVNLKILFTDMVDRLYMTI